MRKLCLTTTQMRAHAKSVLSHLGKVAEDELPLAALTPAAATSLAASVPAELAAAQPSGCSRRAGAQSQRSRGCEHGRAAGQLRRCSAGCCSRAGEVEHEAVHLIGIRFCWLGDCLAATLMTLGVLPE